jgi:hypothetical protein
MHSRGKVIVFGVHTHMRVSGVCVCVSTKSARLEDLGI